MQNFWMTDTWTTNQFQAFMVWCWANQNKTCNPATAKAFMKTDTFKNANK